jgi:carbon-monoxide dehydrogenase medium subunit
MGCDPIFAGFEPDLMQSFDYVEPPTLEDLLACASDAGEDGVLLAGGQTLLIMLRMSMSMPDTVISLRSVRDLTHITPRQDGSLRIGAMATYRALTGPEVAERLPLLARAASSVGSIHIRTLGTIGGAVAHADPAADVPAALLALDAEYVIASLGGTATVAAADFVTGLLQTRLEPGSVLVEVVVPSQPAGARFGYRRFHMREGEYPMAQAAVRLVVEAGTIASARLVVGGGGDRTERLADIEAWLVGSSADPALGDELKSRVERSVHPYTDARGSSAWKAEVVGVMAKRALADALQADALRPAA